MSEAPETYTEWIKEAVKSTPVERHADICSELTALYGQKNKAYGNSFHDSFMDYGLVMAAIRLGDKYNRFKTLAKNPGIDSADESIRDTLIDLANYAVMTVMELDASRKPDTAAKPDPATKAAGYTFYTTPVSLP